MTEDQEQDGSQDSGVDADPLTAAEQQQLQTLQQLQARKQRELQAIRLGLNSFQRQILESRDLSAEGRYVVQDGEIRRAPDEDPDGEGTGGS